MQSDAVTVLIRMQLLPAFVEQGKEDLLDLAREVRQVEPDCLAIEVAHDEEDPTKITMIEKWSRREAYEGPHMQSPHMKRLSRNPASSSLVRRTYRSVTQPESGKSAPIEAANKAGAPVA